MNLTTKMKTTLIAAAVMAAVMLGTMIAPMITVRAAHAACSGNPHDSGTSGNPHDNGESGNPHDTTVHTHHGPNPEADTCPGSK
jgi:hypothetical protein